MNVHGSGPSIAPIVLGVVFIAAVLIVAVIAELCEAAVERDCRRAGYPNARVDWGGLGTGYCVKRVNQTDIVVPVDEARRR